MGINLLYAKIKIFKFIFGIQFNKKAGQEGFRSITKGYYRGSAGCLVVYDITSRDSFNHAQKWIEDMREETGNYASVVLVGNKSDLLSKYIMIKVIEGKCLKKKENNLPRS